MGDFRETEAELSCSWFPPDVTHPDHRQSPVTAGLSPNMLIHDQQTRNSAWLQLFL